ncbi:MAG: hypothetical protein HYY16_18610 [Planctomycetes bacterium]|nr:hypothetical protein [Planctomycetota bacterium]
MNGVRWWTDAAFAERVRAGPFANLEQACARAVVVKDLRAKRTLEFRDGDVTWIIKIYKPGSTWRRLRTLLRGTRARHELRAGREAERRGVPVVPVTAAAEWPGGSAVIVRKLEGWTSLELTLRTRSDAALLARYGAFARRVHDAGVLQDDFNPSNVLIRGDQLRLIDFERLSLRRRLTEAQRLRLVAKLVRLRTVGRAGLEPFLAGYLRPDESRDAVLARILSFARRQARRDRARLAKNCVRENRNFGRIETKRHVGFFRKAHAEQEGLTAAQAEALLTAPDGVRLEHHPDAPKEWLEANLRTIEGGAPPLAVWHERGRRDGVIAYRP